MNQDRLLTQVPECLLSLGQGEGEDVGVVMCFGPLSFYNKLTPSLLF